MANVVIDPGHGGTVKVGGSSPNNATSSSGLLEKDLTLVVAHHAATALAAHGHTVHLTRIADVNPSLVDRAALARATGADAFVSIHFNGFGDTTVQGTETWVHQAGSTRSVDLASCVQRSVVQATGHRDRGVKRMVLGVVDPANHAPGTAACLAELSFITTTAEDARLHDPEYLKALGGAVANGVHTFVGQEAVPFAASAAERAIAPVGPGGARAAAARAAAFRAPVEFSTSATVSPTALAVATLQPPLADVREALDALPQRGRKTRYAGPVATGGNPASSHIQGMAGYKDVLLLTHSDSDEESGRILVLDRVGPRKVIAEFRLPTFSTSGQSFFHAGGCQILGDLLAVPSESGQNASVIAFFDVSDPLHIREFNGALRIFRDTRDAAAVGITTLTRNGQTVWLLAAYDSGTVDFYESPDLPGGALFAPRFSFRIAEKNHQHLLLLTDQANRVFAVGLNRGNFPFFDDLIVYEVDLAAGTMTADPDREISTGGGTRLRWGAALEVAGTRLVLHCTERDYGDSCTINTFDPAAPAARREAAKSAVARGRTAAKGKKKSRKKASKTGRGRKGRSRKKGRTRTVTGSTGER
jgi:N-acetylmuramoyl-L-alanine amidase